MRRTPTPRIEWSVYKVYRRTAPTTAKTADMPGVAS